MFVWLPPSESKTAPAGGGLPDAVGLDLARLVHPGLAAARAEVLDALARTSARPDAAAILGLGPATADEAATNLRLVEASCAPALSLFTGVLYDALDAASLDEGASAAAASVLRIFSGAFGVLGASDPVPDHRLSMGVDLPGIGPLARFWRPRLDEALREETEGECVVDARSGTYASACPAPWADLVRIGAVRETGARRQTISHDAKRWRGLVVRRLLALGAHADEDAILESLAALPGEIRIEDAKGVPHAVIGVEISDAARSKAGGRARTAVLVTD